MGRARGQAAIRVAIVDDHRLVLDGLSSRLHEPANGISIVVAETSWAALIAHPEFPVDVVVLDLHLEDGIPVGTKLRALGTIGTAAIVMSRHADSASVTAAMRAGAMGFVPKTESAAELAAAIRAAADSTPHLSAPLAEAIAGFAASPDPGLGTPGAARARALRFWPLDQRGRRRNGDDRRDRQVVHQARPAQVP